MKSHKSEAAITFQYLHQPGNSVCVGKDTSKQNVQNMKARVKTKHLQLSNKYRPSAHVLTRRKIRAIKLPPNQKRERTTGGEKRLMARVIALDTHTRGHSVTLLLSSVASACLIILRNET